MDHPLPKNMLTDLFGRLQSVWKVMFGAVVALAVVTLLFFMGAKPLVHVDEKLVLPFISMLMTVAFIDLGVMIFLDRRFKSPASVKNYLKGKGATAVNVDLTKVIYFDDEKLSISLLPHYFQMCVIRWALVISVGAYGFIIAMVTGSVLAPMVFYAVAAAFMMNTKPDMEELRQLLKHAREVSDQL